MADNRPMQINQPATVTARKYPTVAAGTEVLIYVSGKDGVSRVWAKPGDDLSDMKADDLAIERKRGTVVDVLVEV